MENAAEVAFALNESRKIEPVLREEIWGNLDTHRKENDEINRRHGQVGGFNPPKGTPSLWSWRALFPCGDCDQEHLPKTSNRIRRDIIDSPILVNRQAKKLPHQLAMVALKFLLNRGNEQALQRGFVLP